MKKLMFMLCLLTASVAAKAQFEQGKWFFNPSITGLELSHSKADGTQFGLEMLGGAFVVDNVALLLNLGGHWADDLDTYSFGAGGRFYFEATGIYLGGIFKMKRLDFDNYDGQAKDRTDFAICPEVGYAFFIGKNITIEPSVFYDISLKDNDFSKYGLKLGFGIYF